MTRKPKRAKGAVGAADVGKIIARAKRELEHMIDVNPQAMVLVDQAGSILRANRALLRLAACSEFSEVLGRKLDEVFAMRDEDVFERLLAEEGVGQGLETGVALAGGANHILRFCLLGMGRSSDFYVVIAEDVTETRVAEAAVHKELKREAVQALMGALMHNLNQPLTVISVRAKLLALAIERKQDLDTGMLSENLEEITRSCMQVADIVRSVENPHDYVTETYVDGLEILDLQGSGG